MTAIHRAAHALLLAVVMSAASWVAGPPPAAPDAVATMRVASPAHDSEELINRVEFIVQLCGAVAAQPGARPPFIPTAALVVQNGEFDLVGLGEALTGRAGQVVIAAATLDGVGATEVEPVPTEETGT